MFNFKTINEFNDYFKEERICLEFLEQVRWNGQPTCPHCGSQKHYKVRTTSKRADLKGTFTYRCAEFRCDKPYNVKVGSIFESSKLSLRTWFTAIYFIVADKKGISSINLSKKLGVTQKTAWFMLHRIREMLQIADPTMLTGIVEADETYIGGKNKNRHWSKKVPYSQGRSSKDKTPVVGLLCRDLKLRTFVVEDTSRSTLTRVITENVSTTSLLITDAYKGYFGLNRIYEHVSVKHSGNYITDSFYHTNNIEGFWSHLKRGLTGVYHQVRPHHLQRYCNEFTYRYNNRNLTLVEKFQDVISNCNQRLTYDQLRNK